MNSPAHQMAQQFLRNSRQRSAHDVAARVFCAQIEARLKYEEPSDGLLADYAAFATKAAGIFEAAVQRAHDAADPSAKPECDFEQAPRDANGSTVEDSELKTAIAAEAHKADAARFLGHSDETVAMSTAEALALATKGEG